MGPSTFSGRLHACYVIFVAETIPQSKDQREHYNSQVLLQICLNEVLGLSRGSKSLPVFQGNACNNSEKDLLKIMDWSSLIQLV